MGKQVWSCYEIGILRVCFEGLEVEFGFGLNQIQKQII